MAEVNRQWEHLTRDGIERVFDPNEAKAQMQRREKYLLKPYLELTSVPLPVIHSDFEFLAGLIDKGPLVLEDWQVVVNSTS